MIIPVLRKYVHVTKFQTFVTVMVEKLTFICDFCLAK